MCEFDRDYTKPSGSRHDQYQDFLRANPKYIEYKGRRSEQDILDMIKREELRGFIITDFECSPELKKIYDLFPLIFKKTEVSRGDCGELMARYLEQEGLLQQPKIELISSHFGKQLLISTDLCRWYMKWGVEVSNVERVIQYKITDILSPFVDMVCEMRYENSRADATTEDKVIGSMAKALCLSIYGRMMYNPAKIVNVSYLNNKNLLKSLYSKKVISIDYVGELEGGDSDFLYEMRSRPKKVNYRSPVHCSGWILNQAKLRMLQLVYDLLYTHFRPECYTFFCMQTDSLSLLCSERNLEDFIKNCVIKGKEESFEEIRDDYFVNPNNPRSKFKDGLFKREWAGKIALGCSSKVYCVFDENNKVVKLACRSLPHSVAKTLQREDFHRVLNEHKPIIVKYRNFNYILGEMLCEEVKKCVITPYYIKRKVNSDLTTSTLDK